MVMIGYNGRLFSV